MRRLRPWEKQDLIIEIIKHLINEGYLCPSRLSVESLKNRVSHKEQQYIPGLTDDMDDDDEIPLEKVGQTICVTDASEARDFVKDQGGLI